MIIAIRLGLGLFGWFLFALALGLKIGPFLSQEERLFGYVVPRHIRRS
jgi:hypothetical protein